MANAKLFGGKGAKPLVVAPPAQAVNPAGGAAYALPARQALAQLAVTGTFGDGFYESAEVQLGRALQLLADPAITPGYVGRLACYAREAGSMKDMPAFLCAWLLTRQTAAAQAILARVFPRVIDSGRMLRTFAQIVRSGVLGKRNLSGRFAQRLIAGYCARRSVAQLFRDSVGDAPSLLDVVRMAHPKLDAERSALLGVLRGKIPATDPRAPQIMRDLETFKLARAPNPNAESTSAANVIFMDPPDVEFRLLTACKLTPRDWQVIAKRGGWQQTRMNLRAYARAGVFADAEATRVVCDRLRDRDAIAKARMFPYQLFVAYMSATGGVATRGAAPTEGTLPPAVLAALQDALDVAIESTPALACGSVVVAVDCSGSMHNPITGKRGEGQTSVVRCIDVAALFAAQVLRQNPGSTVWKFDGELHKPRLNPRDSAVTLAETLTKGDTGATNYSLALAEINRLGLTPDLVIYFGDMASWADASCHAETFGTAAMREFVALRQRHPKARAVCVNLQTHGDAQLAADGSVLNVGGWSQAVWEQVRRFVAGTPAVKADPEAWVKAIDALDLEAPATAREEAVDLEAPAKD